MRAYESPGESSFCVSTQSAEATFVLSGEMVLEMGPAQQDMRVMPGQGCVVLRGTPHQTHTTKGTRFLVVDLPRMPTTDLGIVRLPSGIIHPVTNRLVERLWEQDRPLVVSDLQRSMNEMISRLSPAQLVSLEGMHDTRRVSGVKAFLERHHADTVRLGELARSFNMDRYYLVRSFKRNFGVPPLTYLQFLRLEHFVWSLMRRGHDAPLTEHSLDAGFGDYSTFCRRIRKHFGRPPSDLVQVGSAAPVQVL